MKKEVAAKLDDALNFIPARLGGLIITGCNVRALKVFLRDRHNHKSPNSAHGESAFAGALNIKLGGGAFYNGKFEFRPLINSQGRVCNLYDIVRAWRLLDRSCALFAVIIILSLFCIKREEIDPRIEGIDIFKAYLKYLILIIIFYFMTDGVKVRSAILRLFPNNMRKRTSEIIDTISERSGGYVIAQIVTMASVDRKSTRLNSSH